MSSLDDLRSTTHDQRSTSQDYSAVSHSFYDNSWTVRQIRDWGLKVSWPPYHPGKTTDTLETTTHTQHSPQPTPGHNLNHQPYPLQPQTPTTTTDPTEINLLCFCQCVSGLASYLKLHSTSCNMSIKWAWFSKLSNMLSKVEKYLTRVNNSD